MSKKPKKVIIMKGLPGSGKTTVAKALQIDSPNEYKRVNKDDLRMMLDDGRHTKGNENFVLEVRDFIIKRSLELGYKVIVDDTNLHEKHLARIKALVDGEADVEVKFIDTPLRDCISRDALRPKPVGKKVIVDMYNQFLKPKREVVEVNHSLRPAIICDIDGTLAKMSGRSPYDWKRVGEDAVNMPIYNIYAEYYGKATLILLSGRNSVCRPETEEWLSRNEIVYDYLYMRAENDDRKDWIVKEEIYRNHIQGKYNVLFVLDDRNQVVEMWREKGLVCLQVDDGDF